MYQVAIKKNQEKSRTRLELRESPRKNPKARACYFFNTEQIQSSESLDKSRELTS
jgi:hypothetical protein